MRKWTIATTLLMVFWTVAPVSANAEEKATENTEEAASEEGTGQEGTTEEAEKKEKKTCDE